MSDIMRPVPFGELLQRIIGELKGQESIFGIKASEFYHDDRKDEVQVFNQKCTTPMGPAAGPHTQLAQNIISSYLAGARFIELKTCQIMDTLEVSKPCIDARDECYNVEWSTEYTLEKAADEYLKAWIILHIIDIATMEGKWKHPSFIFNMSVGYTLEGIKSEKMQRFIDTMIDATANDRFSSYIEEIETALDDGLFAGTIWEGREGAVRESLSEISSHISPSVTISTMHGCPPKEIEAICSYMLTEKKLDTFVKLNPTLLGYDTARAILDKLGYTYVGLKRETFEKDLQFVDAIAMLKRLVALASSHKRGFGVKLTNTLGSVNDQGQLPGEEMYMSGRALLPLSLTVVQKISREFDGKLPVSYAGGANALSVADIFDAGIHPITCATDMLKPGGYQRLTQMSEILKKDRKSWKMDKIDLAKLDELVKKAGDPAFYSAKDVRGTSRVKIGTPLELVDCYVAPCQEACPIHQDIPEYVHLMGEGRYAEALAVIYDKNALPNITGWICDHQCQNHCTRLDYEGAISIREIKRIAAEKGMKEYLEDLWSCPEEPADVSAAVIGAGPAGLSAAYFLARAGFKVTILEREEDAGGVVRNIIPSFRIPEEVVAKDIAHVLRHGVAIRYGVKSDEVTVSALKDAGFDYCFYALGAEKNNAVAIDGKGKVDSAIAFLGRVKKGESVQLGRHVVVVGGGNTAMDTARAAKRVPGVETVTVVYRRSESEMPADKEEYQMALSDGITFRFLTNPKAFAGDSLVLSVMKLGEKDASGRARPVETGETCTINCDMVLTAAGEKADSEMATVLGLACNAKGWPVSNPEEGVYCIGDFTTGPSTVVRAIASAQAAVDDCIDRVVSGLEDSDEDDDHECHCHDDEDEEHECHCHDDEDEEHECHCHDDEDEDEDDLSPEEMTKAEEEFFAEIRAKAHKIVLDKVDSHKDEKAFLSQEAKRCVECSYLCNKCVSVCPNRANVALDVRSSGLFDNPFQILHLDAYCNECGNCETFCPHDGGPYKKKFTLFSRMDDFESSTNSGFFVQGDSVYLRLDGKISKGSVQKDSTVAIEASEEIREIMHVVLTDYAYLLGSVED